MAQLSVLEVILDEQSNINSFLVKFEFNLNPEFLINLG